MNKAFKTKRFNKQLNVHTTTDSNSSKFVAKVSHWKVGGGTNKFLDLLLSLSLLQGTCISLYNLCPATGPFSYLSCEFPRFTVLHIYKKQVWDMIDINKQVKDGRWHWKGQRRAKNYLSNRMIRKKISTKTTKLQ